jgi:hypothetical protein
MPVLLAALAVGSLHADLTDFDRFTIGPPPDPISQSLVIATLGDRYFLSPVFIDSALPPALPPPPRQVRNVFSPARFQLMLFEGTTPGNTDYCEVRIRLTSGELVSLESETFPCAPNVNFSIPWSALSAPDGIYQVHAVAVTRGGSEVNILPPPGPFYVVRDTTPPSIDLVGIVQPASRAIEVSISARDIPGQTLAPSTFTMSSIPARLRVVDTATGTEVRSRNNLTLPHGGGGDYRTSTPGPTFTGLPDGLYRLETIVFDWVGNESCSERHFVLDGGVLIEFDAGVSGTVRDGFSEGHSNPLKGVLVELKRGTEVVQTGATDAQGRYAFSGVEPGTYTVSVSLRDAENDPPVFQVGSSLLFGDLLAWAATGEFLVGEGESVVKDIFFSEGHSSIATTNVLPREVLDDTANVFFRTRQYVDWLEDSIAPSFASPNRPLPVEFDLFALVPTSGYGLELTRVFISFSDSLYDNRDVQNDHGPENVEWHEFTHHLYATNIDDTICPGELNHGGYLNPSTCDSLSEGLAAFLPTIATVPGETSDSVYAIFGSLEVNAWNPWPAPDGSQREDLAVASLLWDLVDGVNLNDTVCTQVISSEGAHVEVGSPYLDWVRLPLRDLWQIIDAADATTVADLRDALLASNLEVLRNAKTIRHDLDGDVINDASDLDVVFLMHGFHPVLSDEANLAHTHYNVRSPEVLGIPGSARNRAVGRTDSEHPVTFDFRNPRRNFPILPGEHVRVNVEDAHGNPLDGGTLLMTITYPEITVTSTRPLPGGTGNLIPLVLPPHFGGLLRAGDPLPPCDVEEAYEVTVALRVALGTQESRESSFTNCEYARAIAGSTEDFALEFTFTLGEVDVAVPGDCNQDGAVDISDAICLFGFLFLGSPSLLPCGDGSVSHASNIALIDWQPDGQVDISDGISLLRYLFSGGEPHPLGTECVETSGCPATCTLATRADLTIEFSSPALFGCRAPGDCPVALDPGAVEQPFQVSYQLANRGQLFSGPFTQGIQLLDSTRSEVLRATNGFDGLKPGQTFPTATGFAFGRLLPPGQYVIRLAVDLGDEVEETSEDNNVAELEITIVPP